MYSFFFSCEKISDSLGRPSYDIEACKRLIFCNNLAGDAVHDPSCDPHPEFRPSQPTNEKLGTRKCLRTLSGLKRTSHHFLGVTSFQPNFGQSSNLFHSSTRRHRLSETSCFYCQFEPLDKLSPDANPAELLDGENVLQVTVWLSHPVLTLTAPAACLRATGLVSGAAEIVASLCVQ